jgi:hypothetical protein
MCCGHVVSAVWLCAGTRTLLVHAKGLLVEGFEGHDCQQNVLNACRVYLFVCRVVLQVAAAVLIPDQQPMLVSVMHGQQLAHVVRL